ncbi:ATP-binding protein [Rodentibacter haemolyticus]|uniref:ATP-binding protein n=1 Tax=Rodentibacter haemolyticus TaxID=2778911 RepID=A0ABX6V1J5_9PAST|nr:ATP-binding protein [Rodentibacter haemolyticus]QPB42186.1 ATP-binding protein [Rodentibacter haemolyticus]
MQFQKAERKKSKLRLALTGPSGSGKTYGALLLASGLGNKIAVIDTEQGSASLYSHLAEFDCLELEPPYTPERYREALKLAVQSGHEVVVIDSITHEWSGSGGCLELLEQIAKAKYKNNTWAAWNDITPRHRAFIDDLLTAPLHIIVTARSKTETAQVEVNGRKQVQKLGMKTEQRDGIEYEFTTVLDIVHDGHYALPSKDRTGLFNANTPEKLSKETGERVKKWLESGVELPSAGSPSAPPQQPNNPTMQKLKDGLRECKTKQELEERYSKQMPWLEGKYPDLIDEYNGFYDECLLNLNT